MQRWTCLRVAAQTRTEEPNPQLCFRTPFILEISAWTLPCVCVCVAWVAAHLPSVVERGSGRTDLLFISSCSSMP